MESMEAQDCGAGALDHLGAWIVGPLGATGDFTGDVADRKVPFLRHPQILIGSYRIIGM